MSLGEDLKNEVKQVFADAWTTRDGQVVPRSEDLKLSNDAVILDGTVLYADLDKSTSLVDNYRPPFAAEVYKSFLHCAAKIICSNGGSITSYDGDRIMAVFLGDSKNSDAARTALKINYAVIEIINPAIKAQYPSSSFTVGHVVGIDSSSLFVARTGIRGSNDLVWVGRAANYAAKLSARNGPPSQLTSDVYVRLNQGSKFGNDGRNMWSQSTAPELGGRAVYSSSWYWAV